MFRYQLRYEDGDDAGQATYADNVNVGDEIMMGPGKYVRVLDVIDVAEPGSKFEGLLKVELV
jgi:hypothetical protein